MKGLCILRYNLFVIKLKIKSNQKNFRFINKLNSIFFFNLPFGVCGGKKFLLGTREIVQ